MPWGLCALTEKSPLELMLASLQSVMLRHWMSIRNGCQLISPAEKELTISSNCLEKQSNGITLKVQLSKKASLTKKRLFTFLLATPPSISQLSNDMISYGDFLMELTLSLYNWSMKTTTNDYTAVNDKTLITWLMILDDFNTACWNQLL